MYTEIRWKPTRTFQVDDSPEVIHIVESGLSNKYVMFSDNQYDVAYLGTFTQQEIKERYEIDLVYHPIVLQDFKYPQTNEQ